MFVEPVLKLEPVTTPTAFISLSVIVRDPVPTVNIPVTLAFPVTTKSSVNVVAPPTRKSVKVPIPAVILLTPAPATIGPLKLVAVIIPALAILLPDKSS